MPRQGCGRRRASRSPTSRWRYHCCNSVHRWLLVLRVPVIVAGTDYRGPGQRVCDFVALALHPVHREVVQPQLFQEPEKPGVFLFVEGLLEEALEWAVVDLEGELFSREPEQVHL